MEHSPSNHDGVAMGAWTPAQEHGEQTAQPYNPSVTVYDQNDPAARRRRTKVLQQTYLYLSVAVFACMAGAFFGSMSKPFLLLFFNDGSFISWIVAMFVMNATLNMALNVAHNNPRMAVPALGGAGLVCGLVLAPLVFLGTVLSGEMNLVHAAMIVTASVFGAITMYVFQSGANFTMGKGVAAGVFGTLVVAIPLNVFWLQSSLFANLISLAIGVFGAAIIAHATSAIVNDPEFDDPAAGALSLFVGLFNLFQAVLSLLLGGGRD